MTPTGYSRNIQDLLDSATLIYRSQTENGKPASYIPELANADPNLFSLSATTADGTTYSSGDSETPFSMQSISKVAGLAYALERFGGEKVFARVGTEPCAEPFNSIMKLEIASITPLNPFINSGAICISALIAEALRESALEDLLGFASSLAGRPAGSLLEVNEKLYASEAATADRNRSLAYFMHSTGALSYDVEETLTLYFKLCSIEADARDLSTIGATIALGGVNPKTGKRILKLETAYTLIGLMSTCGLYNESGEFAIKVGIPAKSGVSGGILCAVPGKMGIAAFSPLLDSRGNSVAGLKALAHLSAELKLRGI